MTPEQVAGLVPGKVQKIVVTGDDCVIELFAGSKKFLLLRPGRVDVVDDKPVREAGEPPALQGQLRKELQPAILSRIDQAPGGDRLLFARQEGPARIVVVEADGRDPRWLVVAPAKEGEAGERILACSPGTRALDGRDLRRGRLYEPPRAPSPMGVAHDPASSSLASSSSSASSLRPFADPALTQLRLRLKAEIDRKRRLQKALDGDTHKHGDPALLEEEGELLKTVMGTLKRGQKTVDVHGYDGVLRTLVVDPAKDARQNLLARFTKAKKARTAITRAAPRIAEARSALAALEAARAALAAAPDDVERRREVESLLALGGPTARRKAAIETVQKSGKRQPWRAFVVGPDASAPAKTSASASAPASAGPVVVRVGRGAKDNDALVKASKGHDLWLHARDATGAHVVVPSNGGPVADDVLRDAALLGAWFSTLRGERTVMIQHTRVKNLKKPGAGAPAGLWLVGHEAVLTLRVDDERTAALLKREVAG